MKVVYDEQTVKDIINIIDNMEVKGINNFVSLGGIYQLIQKYEPYVEPVHEPCAKCQKELEEPVEIKEE